MSTIIKQDNRNMEPGVDYYIFECPGCKCSHSIKVPGWTFNGDYEKPTIFPSILVTYPHKEGVDICHSFVKDGIIQFLGDCTHELKNQTVSLENI